MTGAEPARFKLAGAVITMPCFYYIEKPYYIS